MHYKMPGLRMQTRLYWFRVIAFHLQENKTIGVGSVKYASAESYRAAEKVSVAILEFKNLLAVGDTIYDC